MKSNDQKKDPDYDMRFYVAQTALYPLQKREPAGHFQSHCNHQLLLNTLSKINEKTNCCALVQRTLAIFTSRVSRRGNVLGPMCVFVCLSVCVCLFVCALQANETTTQIPWRSICLGRGTRGRFDMRVFSCKIRMHIRTSFFNLEKDMDKTFTI